MNFLAMKTSNSMLEPANHWARIDWTRMWWAESVDWKALAEKGTGLDEQNGQFQVNEVQNLKFR